MRKYNLQLLIVAIAASVATSQKHDAHGKVNKTLGLVLTQEFFDNVQFNLTEKLLNSANLTLLEQQRIDLDLEIMKIDANITNVTIVNATLSEQAKMITLYDDYLIFDLKNMNLDLDIDYEYISEPPILVDIGLIDVAVEDFKLFINVSSTYADYDVTFLLTNFSVGLGSLGIEIDGLSDFSIIANDLLHTVLWLVGSRIKELTTTRLQDKFVPLANKFLSSMSDSIPLTATGLHLDVAFASNIVCKADDYLQLPLSLSLQSDAYPYTKENNATFPDYNRSDFQMEALITEYLINNFLYELHYEKLINISLGELSSCTVGLLKFTGLTFDGYNDSSTCEVIITTVDPYPVLSVHTNQSEATLNASLEFKCKQQPNDTVFVHALNMYFDIKIDFNLTINDTSKLVVYVKSLTMAYQGFDQSTVGSVSEWRMNLYITVIQSLAASLINILLGNGIDINWIINDLIGIKFLYFEKINLINLEELILFRMLPVFNITSETAQQLVNFQTDTSRNVHLTNIGDIYGQNSGGFEEYVSGKLDYMFDEQSL